jgi:hypothetical protein
MTVPDAGHEVRGDACMDQFSVRYSDKPMASWWFDRVSYLGDLPFDSGRAMASILEARQIHRRDVKLSP